MIDEVVDYEETELDNSNQEFRVRLFIIDEEKSR